MIKSLNQCQSPEFQLTKLSINGKKKTQLSINGKMEFSFNQKHPISWRKDTFHWSNVKKATAILYNQILSVHFFEIHPVKVFSSHPNSRA